MVNEWIRHGGWFDSVIDFDKCIRDVADTLKINDALQADYLHPTQRDTNGWEAVST